MAPTLFGRNTENCLTRGPSILEIVSGELRAMGAATRACRRGPFGGERNYLTGSVFLANGILEEDQEGEAGSSGLGRSRLASVTPAFSCSFEVASAPCVWHFKRSIAWPWKRRMI